MRHEKQSSRTNVVRKQEIIAIPSQVETCPFYFREVLLTPDRAEAPSEADLKQRLQGGAQTYRSRTEVSAARRINSAGISALSRRLMSMERARALGRKRIDFRFYILEIEAKRWAEERAKRK